MASPLTAYGYCRREYTRTRTVDSGGTHTTSWTYSAKPKTESPSSFYIGGHGYTSSSIGGGTSYAKYRDTLTTDYPYLKFSLPASFTGQTLRLYITSSYTQTAYVRRITDSTIGDAVPAATETHQESISVAASSAWYTVNIGTLLSDLNSNGNYGLLLVTDSPTIAKASIVIVASGIEFSWTDASVTTPTYSTTSANIGSSMTITTNNANSSVTNTLRYSFGSASGTIASNVGNTTTTWSIPAILADQIPNATSGSCTITCESFIGGSSLGKTTKIITLNVPDTSSYKPSITSVTFYDTNATCRGWGVYVQGKSALTCTINTSTSSAHGATVTGYSIAINGGTLTGNGQTTTTLKTSGINSYTATITDSRGRTTTYTSSFTVQAYSAPTVTFTNAERNSSTKTTVNTTYAWTYSSCNSHNSLQIKLKLDGTQKSLSTASGTIGSANYNFTEASELSSHIVRIEGTDGFTTVSYEVRIPIATPPPIDVGTDSSVGIGEQAGDDGTLTIGLPTKFDNGITGGQFLYVDENGNVTSTNATNPNLFDNPWFTVNQRGATTNITEAYGVDRWKADVDSTYSVDSNDGHLVFTLSDNTKGVAQYFDMADPFVKYLFNKQLTFSCKAGANKSVGFEIDAWNSKYAYSTIESATRITDDDGYASFTFTMSIGSWGYSYLCFRIIPSTNESTADLYAAKLELGDVSTIKCDSYPDYATELLKCQRYLFVLKAVGNKFAGSAMSFTNSTILHWFTPTPVPMRANPEATFSQDPVLFLRAAGSGKAPTTVLFDYARITGSGLNVQFKGMDGISLTQFTVYGVYLNGDITFTAEI